MKTSIKILFTAVLQFFFMLSMAQFVTPLESISGDVICTKADGVIIEGELKNAMTGSNGLMSFKIMDFNGRDHKLKADDVRELKIKVDGLAKLEIIAEQSANLEKLANSNFEEVVTRDYIIWQQVKHPEKDKNLLLQLVNPGFDSKIKVYDSPGSRSAETSVNGVATSGGQATAYYVVKDGKTIKLTKKDYKKGAYSELFADCPSMKKDKPDLSEFALDILEYNQCEN